MRIELATLEGAKGTFAHSYVEGELVLEEERLRLVQPPTVSGEIRREDRRVHVKGRVLAQVQVECDRCLKLIELPVDSNFKLEYVTREDYQAQQAVELTEVDLDLTVFDGEVIDIDALVTEEILLAVPDHILCKDDCKGICPGCGADRNSVDCGCQTAVVDPRWAGLKELVNGK
ncbi:MAG: DUF177 domain-containing protein [Acidobacteriota bacterium]|nr:DUF177 domain-containing protein [Acidobacteriota bacterium]